MNDTQVAYAIKLKRSLIPSNAATLPESGLTMDYQAVRAATQVCSTSITVGMCLFCAPLVLFFPHNFALHLGSISPATKVLLITAVTPPAYFKSHNGTITIPGTSLLQSTGCHLQMGRSNQNV